MKERLKEIFSNEDIEYFAHIPIGECKIINESLYERTVNYAKSVIIFLIPYYDGDRSERNISLYATAKDYHLYVKMLSDRISPKLAALFPNNRFHLMADHSPIAETHAAASAGLGIIGDNYRLINKKYGSYVFIAEIFTDLECITSVKAIANCHHCGACRRACPSKEVCLSFLTQQKGELSEETVKLMKDNNTAWGCDICQTVCPLNQSVECTPIDFFKKDIVYRLTPEILDNMTDDELKERAFGWRKRKTIERNIKLLSE